MNIAEFRAVLCQRDRFFFALNLWSSRLLEASSPKNGLLCEHRIRISDFQCSSQFPGAACPEEGVGIRRSVRMSHEQNWPPLWVSSWAQEAL